MTKLIRDPFTQFLILGGLIFVIFGLNQSRDETDSGRYISVDAPTQAWLYENFSKQFRRPPTRPEMDALIQSYLRDEVKYREALALGLDERDTIVRRRMMQKFDFLFGDAGASLAPSDEELKRWYEKNIDNFIVPAALSFEHRWFSPDARGTEARADASLALLELKVGETPSSDAFPFGESFEKHSRVEVRRTFGPQFADIVFSTPLDQWKGPVESGLGFHLIRVTQKSEGLAPPLEEVRNAVLDAWRRAESERVLAETLATLQSEYTVEIDDAATLQFEFSTQSNVPTQ